MDKIPFIKNSKKYLKKLFIIFSKGNSLKIKIIMILE